MDGLEALRLHLDLTRSNSAYKPLPVLKTAKKPYSQRHKSYSSLNSTLYPIATPTDNNGKVVKGECKVLLHFVIRRYKV